ncbi:MAG: hypothetical protein FWF79_05065 [Defluviitaleaceae bacterium]|nr:hypothetical protein [Defluviitaleaceae bacterium]
MQQAFEFQATTQDGFIRIPDIYAKIMPRKIKVIVLADKTEKDETAPFPYFAVDTTGYVFDREEANER